MCVCACLNTMNLVVKAISIKKTIKISSYIPFILLTPCGQREKEDLITFYYEQRGGGERGHRGREGGTKSLKPRLLARYMHYTSRISVCMPPYSAAWRHPQHVSFSKCVCAFVNVLLVQLTQL